MKSGPDAIRIDRWPARRWTLWWPLRSALVAGRTAAGAGAVALERVGAAAARPSRPVNGWLAFWNGPQPIYVSERHRRVHYAKVADDILQVLPRPQARVLDFGCGAALEAGRVAEACARLYLCEAAETLRIELAERFRGNARIEVIDPEAMDTLPDGSLDLIVVNSVLQYVARGDPLAVAAVPRQAASRGRSRARRFVTRSRHGGGRCRLAPAGRGSPRLLAGCARRPRPSARERLSPVAPRGRTHRAATGGDRGSARRGRLRGAPTSGQLRLQPAPRHLPRSALTAERRGTSNGGDRERSRSRRGRSWSPARADSGGSAGR